MFYLNVKQRSRLLRIIEELGATPNQIAAALNSADKFEWSVLNGRAQISSHDAHRICDQFGINYGYVSNGTGPTYVRENEPVIRVG